MGLSKDDAHYLDVTSGVSFAHKTLAEGREIINKIMENTSFICTCEPPQENPKVHHEEILVAESRPIDTQSLDSTPESSPDPKHQRKRNLYLWNSHIVSKKIFVKTMGTPRTILIKRDH
jgi:hypothetical protein